MYARLLIPLDGSKTAEAVLPYGRTLAEKPPGILKSMLSIKSSPVRILCHPVERYYVNDRPTIVLRIVQMLVRLVVLL